MNTLQMNIILFHTYYYLAYRKREDNRNTPKTLIFYILTD